MVMAPSVAVGTTGLERLLLIFLMKKSSNQTSANETFTSETIDPAINRSKTLKLQRTSKNATTTARRLIRTPKPSQKLAISPRTYHFSTRTPDSLIKNANER